MSRDCKRDRPVGGCCPSQGQKARGFTETSDGQTAFVELEMKGQNGQRGAEGEGEIDRLAAPRRSAAGASFELGAAEQRPSPATHPPTHRAAANSSSGFARRLVELVAEGEDCKIDGE
jgi:hypothetical protein